MHNKRDAFTLIEVMVSVIIISVVIMALLQMHGNSTNLFSNIKERLQASFFPTLLLGNADYGYENKSVDADELVKDFNLDDDLRRRLKEVKLDITYQQLSSIDLSQEDLNATSPANDLLLYTGKTTIKTAKSSISFFRITTRSVK